VFYGDSREDVGPLDTLRGQAGYYIVRERAKGDVRVATAEVMAGMRFTPVARGNLSLAWYGYDNAGNHPDVTTSRYQIVDAIAGLIADSGGFPWRFSAEAISNLSATGRDGTGWALGLSCGAAQHRGDWRAYYQYQEIGNDAVFAPVAGADFLIDHNFRGHVANIDHVLTEEVTLRARVLSSKPLDPALGPGTGETTYRLRFELSVKF
jgi:hypothetical protein